MLNNKSMAEQMVKLHEENEKIKVRLAEEQIKTKDLQRKRTHLTAALSVYRTTLLSVTESLESIFQDRSLDRILPEETRRLMDKAFINSKTALSSRAPLRFLKRMVKLKQENQDMLKVTERDGYEKIALGISVGLLILVVVYHII